MLLCPCLGPLKAEVMLSYNQRLPEEYRKYFYDVLVPAILQRCAYASVQPPAFHGYPVSNGGLPQAFSQTLFFHDENRNNHHDPGEPVYENPDGDYRYRDGYSRRIYPEGTWTVPEYPFFGHIYSYLDRNDNGVLDGEDSLPIFDPSNRGIQGKLLFRDTNGDGSLDIDIKILMFWEYSITVKGDIWQDLDGDNRYTEGVDERVNHQKSWSTPDGSWGKGATLFFSDLNGNEHWDQHEGIWTCTPSENWIVELEKAQRALEELMPRYRDPALAGPVYEGWTKASLLAAIGNPTGDWLRVPENLGISLAYGRLNGAAIYREHFEEVWKVLEKMTCLVDCYDIQRFDLLSSQRMTRLVKRVAEMQNSIFPANFMDQRLERLLRQGAFSPGAVNSMEKIWMVLNTLNEIANRVIARGGGPGGWDREDISDNAKYICEKTQILASQLAFNSSEFWTSNSRPILPADLEILEHSLEIIESNGLWLWVGSPTLLTQTWKPITFSLGSVCADIDEHEFFTPFDFECERLSAPSALPASPPWNFSGEYFHGSPHVFASLVQIHKTEDGFFWEGENRLYVYDWREEYRMPSRNGAYPAPFQEIQPIVFGTSHLGDAVVGASFDQILVIGETAGELKAMSEAWAPRAIALVPGTNNTLNGQELEPKYGRIMDYRGFRSRGDSEYYFGYSVSMYHKTVPVYLSGRVDPQSISYPIPTTPAAELTGLAPFPDWGFPLSVVGARTAENGNVQLDGIVEVEADLAGLGTDTGSLSWVPGRSEPCAILPIETRVSQELPVHAYLVQGAYSGNRLAPQWTYPDVDERGLPYAYSLDTRAINLLYFDDAESNNHVKRVSVIRPDGTECVFDFPWDVEAGKFSATGTPLGHSTCVLHDATPESYWDSAYELQFTSGVVHVFGYDGRLLSVRHVDGRKATVYKGEYSQQGIFAPGAYYSPSLLYTTESSPRYDVTLKWDLGHIASIEYKTHDGAKRIVTELEYGQDGRIRALNKKDEVGNPIPEISYAYDPQTHEIAWNGNRVRREEDGTLVYKLAGLQQERRELATFSAKGLLESLRVQEGASVAVTSYEYPSGEDRYENGAPKWAKLKSITHPDGSWERFEYHADTGWLKKHILPFKGAGPAAVEAQCEVAEYSYDAALSAGEMAAPKNIVELPRRVVRRVAGTEVARSFTAYSGERRKVREVRSAVKPGVAWDDPGNLRTVFTRQGWWPEDVKSPSGEVRTTVQELNAGTEIESTSQRFDADGQGPFEVVRERFNAFGHLKEREVRRGGLVVGSEISSEMDSFGRPLKTDYLGGLYEKYESWGWFGPQSFRAKNGIVTNTTYKPFGKVASATTAGVTMAYGYDAAGRVVSELESGGDLSVSRSRSFDALGRQLTEVDELGRTTQIVYTTNPEGWTRAVTGPDGATVEERHYHGGQLKEISGTAAHPRRYDYGAEPDTGTWRSESSSGDGTNFTDTTRTVSDALGRVVRVERSGVAQPERRHYDSAGHLDETVSPDGVTWRQAYDAEGNLRESRLVVPGGTDRVTTDKSEVSTREGKTVWRHRTEEPSGRVSISESAVDGLESWSSVNGREQHALVAHDISAAGPRTLETSVLPDGARVTQTYENGRLKKAETLGENGRLLASHAYSHDGLGRGMGDTDVRTGLTSRALNNAGETTTVSLPWSAGGVRQVKFSRDGVGRITTERRPEGDEGGFDFDGRSQVIERHGAGMLKLGFGYDDRGLMSTLKTYPTGPAQPVLTSYEHSPLTGDLVSRGSAGSEFEHFAYDAAARPEQVKRPGMQATLSYHASTGEPKAITLSSGAGDAFEWDKAGRLLSTTSTSANADSAVVNYEYNSDDAPLRETLPQLPGVELRQEYDPATGRLQKVRLVKGATTLLEREYGWQAGGLLSTAKSGEHSFTYSYLENSTLPEKVRYRRGTALLLEESRVWRPDADIASGVEFRNATGTLLFSAKHDHDRNLRIAKTRQRLPLIAPGIEVETSYSYDGADQLLTANTLASGLPVWNRSFTYAYDGIGNRTSGGEANPLNQLVVSYSQGQIGLRGTAAEDASVRVLAGAPGSAAATIYEATRGGRLFAASFKAQNAGGATFLPLSVYATRYDSAKNADLVATQAGAVILPPDAAPQTFDGRGNKSTDVIAGYRFDDLDRLAGLEPRLLRNRQPASGLSTTLTLAAPSATAALTGSSAATSATGPLPAPVLSGNTITYQLDLPTARPLGYLRFKSAAPAAPLPTVDSWDGRQWSRIEVTNSEASRSPSSSSSSTSSTSSPSAPSSSSPSPSGEGQGEGSSSVLITLDFHAVTTARLRVRESANTPNLSAFESGRSAMEPALKEGKLEFAYDFMGRRTVKKVNAWNPTLNSGAGGWEFKREIRFAWDSGYKLLAEFDPTGKLLRSYTWGTDVSGTLDGAAGVGGLLEVQEYPASGSAAVPGTPVSYFPFHDARGNIAGYTNESGTIVAAYEYSPFGELLSSAGPKKNDFPFRFSSRYYDAETGLYYFGHRYYDPTTGKWLARDPLREVASGSPNLYAYVGNDPINKIDPIGLALYAFDGTGNDKDDAERTPTHIAALFDSYDNTKARRYVHGVGTRTDKLLGNLAGLGERERLDWMFNEFESIYKNGMGDTDIDIIGFSRGAAEAREFANMIYDKYPSAKIRFLGIFDTVAQTGLPDAFNINYGIRLDIPPNVQYTAHAVAKNEYRSLFPLTSIMGCYKNKWKYIAPQEKYGSDDIKEFQGADYWEKPFSGAHSDAGGGMPDGTNVLALRWMMTIGNKNNVPFSIEQCKSYVDYKFPEHWHDSRYPVLDKVPFLGWGRYSRTIFPGNKE